MKKNFTALLLLSFIISYTQEKGKIRVGAEFGAAFPQGIGGTLVNFEIKYNLADNMNVGFKWSGAAMYKEAILDKVDGKAVEASFAFNFSYVGTFDYYVKTGSSFAPFVGAGLGYCDLATFSVPVAKEDTNDLSMDASGKFVGMFRGGFEAAGFRLSVEYNLIPQSDLISTNINSPYYGSKVATSKN